MYDYISGKLVFEKESAKLLRIIHCAQGFRQKVEAELLYSGIWLLARSSSRNDTLGLR